MQVLSCACTQAYAWPPQALSLRVLEWILPMHATAYEACPSPTLPKHPFQYTTHVTDFVYCIGRMVALAWFANPQGAGKTGGGL